MIHRRRAPSVLRTFFLSEAAGGIVLMGAALLALVAANSPTASTYFALVHAPLGDHDLLHWINDGLMTVFFLLVGLEIKREVIDGELSTWSRRLLPGAAALGGMAAPALVYLAVQQGDPATQSGWAIPAATDIAFALGILALLGRRAPVSLKVFLTALAIIDDLGAVLIIALFYSDHIDLWALGGAGATFAYLLVMNRLRVANLAAYLVAGVLMWWFMLNSGVHATLAGVLLALAIPLRRSRGAPDDPRSPLHRLERTLQPFVAFLVLPIFGFANAGISFAGISPDALTRPVPLGVALGLVLGKQLGVFTTTLLLVKAGLVDLPSNATWRQVYGVAVLCGVGFTMSLFIGGLAFASAELQDAVKLGVLTGSILSALLGALVLVLSPRAVKAS